MRYQLPGRSPLTLAAVARAAGAALPLARDGRPAVAEELARTYGARRVILTGSGTQALTLALAAARGPVALPAYACYDLATAADGAAATVALYDLDATTLQPDEASLAAALARGASAIVLVHLFGLAVDVERVRAQAGDRLIIDDAAQAAGARLGGRPAGALGDFGVLSFGRGKGTTGGGGGALLVMTDRADRVLGEPRLVPPRGSAPLIAALGAQWLLGRPALYGVPASLPMLRLGETVYHPPHPPAAMAPASARVLMTTLPLAAAELAARRNHAARLRAAVPPGGGVLPEPVVGSEPGWLRLPFLAAAPLRERARSVAARRLGIMGGYPQPLVDLPGFGARTVDPAAPYPGARRLTSELITLPTHGLLADGDLRHLEAWLRD